MKKLKLKADMSHGPVNHSSDLEFVDIRKYALSFIKNYNAGKAALQYGVKPKKPLSKKVIESLGVFDVRYGPVSMTFTKKDLRALHHWTRDLLRAMPWR